MDLLHRHNQQSELFESIQEALTCPVCYEFFGRDAAVSLLCGHTFCGPCFAKWEGSSKRILFLFFAFGKFSDVCFFGMVVARSLDAFKLSTIQGVYPGPDCPECRSTDVRRGRVRIWGEFFPSSKKIPPFPSNRVQPLIFSAT